jgi:hypothetical protein
VYPSGTPLSLEDARRLVSGYVDHYKNVSPKQRRRVYHARLIGKTAPEGQSIVYKVAKSGIGAR